METYTGIYVMFIDAETHGMKSPYLAEFYIEKDGTLKSALPGVVILYPKIVKIKTYDPQNGFLIIKDKES